MDNLSIRVSSLSEEKKKLLSLRMQGKRIDNARTSIIKPGKFSTNEPIPMSFAQQRLWFLNELEPGNAFYNMFTALRLNGPVQVEALEKSLNAVIERHEVLRSTYHLENGQPVQKIASISYQQISVIDLQMLPEGERMSEALQLAKEDAQKPFELTKAPLIRMKLIQLQDVEYIVFLNMHHIVADGWSISVFVRELCTLYDSFCNGQQPLLPNLPIQYSDFAHWQREQMQGVEQETQLTYWKERLGGQLPVLQLPTDRPRTSMQTFNGARFAQVIDEELMEKIKKLGRQENSTFFMTFLAAFKILLHKYTDLEDLLVGSPVANRGHVETEGLIGLFVNTIVLRSDLSGDPSFRELMNHVRKSSLGAYAHQDLPFEKLVEVLQPDRNMSHSPLFQVMFILNEPHAQTKTNKVMGFTLERSGLHITPIEIDNNTAKYELTMNIDERQPDGWVCALEYNTDLFNKQTIERLMGHFIQVLKKVVDRPDFRVSELTLITDEEEEQLKLWNDTATEDDLSVNLLELFEAQVVARSENVAVVYGNDSLSYRELDQHVNQLAHYLQKHGVRPGVLVGIYLNRSLEMVLGMLSILKAGGAYVPIDPSYPKERVNYMIQQSGMRIVLTDHSMLQELSEMDVKVVCIDQEADQIASCSTEAPISGVTSEDLAFVIYTSGSTGNPKGVQIQHCALTNLLLSMKRLHALAEDDTVLAVTSISFDISNLEIYLPLISGVKLVVASRNDVFDPSALAKLFVQHKVTMMQATPATFRMLIDAGWKNTTLRKVICGGEAMPRELAASLIDQGMELWNQYGPSETTIYSTCERVESSNEITIGRPIGNTELYVLDANLNRVPLGVPGELYIGGAGLALGYLNRPDLTEERFIPHLFSKEEGARLYRTGDLVRYLSNGKVDYLGRIDHQVKVRGFRIELGEIEAVLERHSEVKQAVSVTIEDQGGDRSIVGYVTATSETLAVTDLYAHMRDFLPEYMIPSVIMILEEMPLTPNGKVDRKTLPEPDPESTSLEVEFIAPRNKFEEQVANVWRQVLYREEVGVNDDFFALGGHSILVTQVISRLQHIYQEEIPVRKFFAGPTVAELAAHLEGVDQGQQKTDGHALVRIPRKGKLPLSLSQQRLWFLNHLEPESTNYNIPFAVRLLGKLNLEAFKQSLNEIVRRHEAIRTVFRVYDGEPEQVILEEFELSIEVLNLRHLEEGDRQAESIRLIAHEARKPFDLANGPLLKVLMLRLEEEVYVVLLNIHHIVSDGWSTTLIIREMSALYESFCKGQPSPLLELPIQYADYSYWQRQRVQGEFLEEQINYWKDKLSGDLPILQLPTDRTRPPIMSHRGASLNFTIPEELNEKLKKFSHENSATLFMTLLAAYQTLLYRYSGQEDICVGSPVAVRNRPELEGMIGFLVNTLVMRTDLGGQPSFLQLLDRVRDVALGAYAHQEVPFEKLAEELQPERDMSRTLFFQAMFVLHNIPLMKRQRMSGLSMELEEFEKNDAQFDLTMSLMEHQGNLEGDLEYNTDVFDSSTMERFIKHYMILLEAILENPNQKIAKLKLLPNEERDLILHDWNKGVQIELPQTTSICHLIERQVEKNPHAIAVEWKDQRLTYGDLNERANKVANYLRKLGVGGGKLVAISVERSLEMVIGLLGILKAGGAYLPLDPAYPQERLAYMLKDSQAEVLLTQKHLKNRLPYFEGRVVLLDHDWTNIVKEPPTPCLTDVTDDHLMYVMYTSGSTGTPKGVMVSHKGVVNHNLAVIRKFDLTSHDRVLQFATVSFDIAVEEIFPTLITGATLVLWKDTYLAEGEEFLRWIDEESITVLNLPTAYWHGWVNDLALLGKSLPKSLRLVVVGGEKASAEVYATWSTLAGEELRWVNTYGPTETTVTATMFEPGPRWKAGKTIPIGRPLDNVEVYVLDAHMQPVPVGVPGELYIGGPGLAKGYLNLPDLTAERFLKNPFSVNMNTHLYKTGDVVRYLRDGNLEYVGRADNQVKIRGYRIELGEIEALLEQYPQVYKAIVVAREDVAGVKRIVGYLVGDTSTLDIGEVKNFLKARLPEYMIPSNWLLLEDLPLTPNGKVDLQALPYPENTLMDARDYIKPRNETEEVVAKIWGEMLNVQSLGVFDNFFEIGGHSLLATQVISRIKVVFQRLVPLSTLFEYPELADFAAQIEKFQKVDPLPPIMKVNREQPLELSFAQQRLWILDQLLQGSPVYNMPFAVRLQGYLDLEALEKSLDEIVRRHEVLRTIFAECKGAVVQLIQEPLSIPLQFIDLTQIDDSESEVKLMQQVKEEAERPFNLQKGPLIRFLLVAKSEQDYVLILNMHHIISDGWSTSILIRELAQLYESFTHNQESPLQNLSVQYADFAHWQRQYLQGGVLEQQLVYWKDKLGGELPILQLPTNRSRKSVQSHQGLTITFQLSEQLTENLKQLSANQGVTLFMTLMAAFQTQLYRYSGQEDICVGTPIAGRNHKETEHLIGFFVNTLVMRNDLSGKPTYLELLKRVRKTALDAYQHQDLPFERLVEELQPDRNMSQTPLFQAMFVLQNVPLESIELPGLSLSTVNLDSQVSKFDLTLMMMEQDKGMTCSFEFNRDLFDSATIFQMAEQFRNLLVAVTATPELSICELPMLSKGERHQLLVEWNDTLTNYPRDLTVHDLFSRQAVQRPNQVAMVFQDQQLTYRELDERANQVANYLHHMGITAGSFVGLCMERSLEMVVGMLGILKAGATYVPLDPAYPADRLTFMMEDAKVRAILTQRHLFDRLPAEKMLIQVDADWPRITQESIAAPPVQVKAEELAYVIYTSGSTGKPKGVCVPHRGIVRLVCGNDYANLSSNEVFLQFSSISFDAATFEIWGSLLNGAKLVIFPATLPSLAELAECLREQQITTLWLTAELFHQMVDEHLDDLKSVRQLLAGGDVLSPSHVKKVLKSLPNTKIINGYGPTESTTFTCCYGMTEIEQVGTTVAIGRPIANTQVFVLDQYQQLVPVGVFGELYIGGDGLATGYLNLPELTADRFIPSPFAEGERLYKTGDLARYLSDGRLEFGGRLDDQVKIRGFRIELGEIQVVLQQQKSVERAILVVHEEKPGDKRLVAYVNTADQSVTGESLKAAMQKELPNYMVPSAIVVLETFPLTPNGKVNRKMLPAPDFQAIHAKEHVAPLNPIEEVVASIWASILNVEQVGIHDNFFDLGGHSLLATQVVSRLNAALQVQVTLRTLFEAPTVTQISEQIEQSRHEASGLTLTPILPVKGENSISLSFAQQRMWVVDRLLTDGSVYNMPYAMRLLGVLDVQALEKSLNYIIERHAALRTTFVEENGLPVQKIAQPSWMPLPVISVVEDFEEAVKNSAELEGRHKFDLSQGPLVRISLFRKTEEESVLLLNMHHIIGDGWSMGILTRELVELYNTYSKGEEPSLPELPIQYSDYANWQREWLQGDVLERQLTYWKEQLEGDIPVLQLPFDRQRPPVQSYLGARETFVLTEELTSGLKALGQRRGSTLFMTLLAGFQTLLSRYTGQEDIAVGTPVAGRSRQETEGLIGCFINTLVMRTDLSGNPTFEELVDRVREVALSAYMHQDIPFELLVDELVTDRNMSHSPLFQVMFVLQNAPISGVESSQLTLRNLEFENEASKFDLTMEMSETAMGLVGSIEYNTDLFEAGTIRRLIGHFSMLLEQVVLQPERQILEVPLLEEEERHKLLSEWNDTMLPYSPDEVMLHQFEEQTLKQPDAVAVIWEDQSLTYGELNAKSNQLARHLQKRGIGKETLVGIAVERTPDMIVGLLGILKAGGAYLPLDPNYPRERIEYVLEDGHALFLLTQEHLLEKLPKSLVECICLDADWAAIAEEISENLPCVANSDNLAYVIYTSGSTGQPKGVAIRHRNAVALIHWAKSVYTGEELSGVLAATSLSFDLSVFEIFVTLSAGGGIILAESALHLPHLPARERITLINTVPSAINELLKMGAIPQSVRTVNLAGEALRSHLVEQLYELEHIERVYNLYGPSEDTTYSTYALLPRASDRNPTIGRPIANTQLYVLDGCMQPVPIGVAGELYIGGEGLAREYLSRPELTAEKFVDNPFTAEVQGRLYKTGDLVRYMLNGELEYLGRLDDQVKVRGFRIELGEIEAQLVKQPEVHNAIVLVREDMPGDKRLVAYVNTADQSVTGESLKAAMQKKLPNFMVPSAIVVLETFPLTPNGKVNRKELPVPRQERVKEAQYVAPRDSIETEIVQIWEELFEIEPIGVQDDFFDLGGHSLLAVRLILMIEKKIGQSLPLALLFQSGTIEQLADVLRSKVDLLPTSHLVRIQGGTQLPLFLVHPIGGNVLCYGELARVLGDDQPVYGLQASGLLEGTTPLYSIEAMAKQYIEEIRNVQPQGPYRLGGWSMGGVIAYEMVQQLIQQGEQVQQLALIDSHLPKQGNAPLTREELVASFVQDLVAMTGQQVPASLIALQEEVCNTDLLSADLIDEHIGRFVDVFSANAIAITQYKPKPLKDVCPILFHAKQGDLEGGKGWFELTDELQVHTLPANHYSIVKRPNVDYIAKKMKIRN